MDIVSVQTVRQSNQPSLLRRESGGARVSFSATTASASTVSPSTLLVFTSAVKSSTFGVTGGALRSPRPTIAATPPVAGSKLKRAASLSILGTYPVHIGLCV